MKTLSEAQELASRWLTKHLTSVVADPTSWTGGPSISLMGTRLPRRVLSDEWMSTYHPWARAWFAHQLPEGVSLREGVRTVGSAPQDLPLGLTFASIEAVCRFAGGTWPGEHRKLAARWGLLTGRFPQTSTAAHLKRSEGWSDIDFDLLLIAASWFTAPIAGWRALTPRQLPIEGLHAKWLDGHRRIVAELAGLPAIELSERPSRVHFTYADPDHRASRERLHDSFTFGDAARPAYSPTTVLICENKDTVVMFPDYPGLIVVEGNGDAGPTQAQHVPWIRDASRVVYWGDMDAKGYVILNRLRQLGVNATSILMDPETHARYARFGTSVERNGTPIRRRGRENLPRLTALEREVYHRLTDPLWDGHPRVEQERIPLHVAVDALDAQSEAIADEPVEPDGHEAVPDRFRA